MGGRAKMMQERAQDAHAMSYDDMVAAFTEWERRYREEPERFMSDVHRFTQETPETYGAGCARTFIGYLDEVRAGYGARTPLADAEDE
jgi:hypothetical protein